MASRSKPSPATDPVRFAAKLLKPASTGRPPTWCFLRLPSEASSKLASRAMVSVEGTFSGARFSATLEPDGEGGHWLKVPKKLRDAAGVGVGDTAELEITPTAEEPEPAVPPDFRKALNGSPGAKITWADTTPAARRDWVQWVTSGKRAETRTLRIAKTCDMLASGKRRPCCFDRSGMYSKSLACPAEVRPTESRTAKTVAKLRPRAQP